MAETRRFEREAELQLVDERDNCPCHRYDDPKTTGLASKCLLTRLFRITTRKIKRKFPGLCDVFISQFGKLEKSFLLVRVEILLLWPPIPANTQRNNAIYRPMTFNAICFLTTKLLQRYSLGSLLKKFQKFQTITEIMESNTLLPPVTL